MSKGLVEYMDVRQNMLFGTLFMLIIVMLVKSSMGLFINRNSLLVAWDISTLVVGMTLLAIVMDRTPELIFQKRKRDDT